MAKTEKSFLLPVMFGGSASFGKTRARLSLSIASEKVTDEFVHRHFEGANLECSFVYDPAAAAGESEGQQKIVDTAVRLKGHFDALGFACKEGRYKVSLSAPMSALSDSDRLAMIGLVTKEGTLTLRRVGDAKSQEQEADE